MSRKDIEMSTTVKYKILKQILIISLQKERERRAIISFTLFFSRHYWSHLYYHSFSKYFFDKKLLVAPCITKRMFIF